MTADWWLDEMAYAGPEHLDPEFVAGYERKAGFRRDDGAPSDEDGEIAADLAALRAAGMTSESTVVDLGAGTGRFTMAVAPHVRRVVAVDVSPSMLDVLNARVTGEGWRNVECVRAGFLSYEHTGAPADVVHTRNALHQLPDFWKALALRRIAGLLRPGGVLRLRDLVYDADPGEVETVFSRWFQHAVDDSARGYTAHDLAEHVRTEFSTFRWLLEPMLDRVGLEVVDSAFVGSVYAAYTCRRR
ncbi:class I SAM-dependent methyltransferase [Actinoalloteichus spitiensis]|uniref:class I SAM-dependent methyltransferase n=1 Tax=Actinoalloteichus spitiensis TaxID=252394 RepID=UPI00037EB69E|nr:class I SAM-dependent methyltransferase [Actinoalloteichus spitiensis]